MPKYVLSAHAQTVVAERSINLDWVERVLAKPEKVEADKERRDLRHAFTPNGVRLALLYFEQAPFVLDYDAKGNLVGIGIDNASNKVQLNKLVLSKLPGNVETVAA